MKQSNKSWIKDGICESFPNIKIDELYPDNYVYEVVRLINGKPLFLQEHHQRMSATCQEKGIFSIPDFAKLNLDISELVKKNFLKDINVKIIIENDHYVIFDIPSLYPSQNDYQQGVRCNFIHEERNNPEMKVYQAKLRKKVDKKKQEAGVYESILVNEQGFISEGSKSNIFFIKDDELYTAPDSLVLSGITRSKIIDICEKASIKVNYSAIHFQKIQNYEAAFLCGTSPGVLPINALEGVDFQVGHTFLQNIHNDFNDLMK